MLCVNCPFSMLCMAQMFTRTHPKASWCRECEMLSVPMPLENTEDVWTPDAFAFHTRAGVITVLLRFDCEKWRAYAAQAKPLGWRVMRGNTNEDVVDNIAVRTCSMCQNVRFTHETRIYNLDNTQLADGERL